MAVESQGCQTVPYCRRHPEKTALYHVAQPHLETYLALAREDDRDGSHVPAYVEREFRRYLECGILAYGFARARCPDCRHSFLAAFSRKGRAMRRSCNARRMAETAAHLVVHYHCCIFDGGFDPEPGAGDAVCFRPAARLTPDDFAAIAEQVRLRVLRWFTRSGLIDRDDVREILLWENSGFSLDTSVRIPARDQAGFERLLRYCARPPFALKGLEVRDEHRVIYRLPNPQRDGTATLTLTPLELIDHLAAQLVHILAATEAASTSLPWHARSQFSAARSCHFLWA